MIKPAPPGPRRSPFRPIQLPFGHPRLTAMFVYTRMAEARLTARAIEPKEAGFGRNSGPPEKFQEANIAVNIANYR